MNNERKTMPPRHRTIGMAGIGILGLFSFSSMLATTDAFHHHLPMRQQPISRTILSLTEDFEAARKEESQPKPQAGGEEGELVQSSATTTATQTATATAATEGSLSSAPKNNSMKVDGQDARFEVHDGINVYIGGTKRSPRPATRMFQAASGMFRPTVTNKAIPVKPDVPEPLEAEAMERAKRTPEGRKREEAALAARTLASPRAVDDKTKKQTETGTETEAADKAKEEKKHLEAKEEAAEAKRKVEEEKQRLAAVAKKAEEKRQEEEEKKHLEAAAKAAEDKKRAEEEKKRVTKNLEALTKAAESKKKAEDKRKVEEEKKRSEGEAKADEEEKKAEEGQKRLEAESKAKADEVEKKKAEEEKKRLEVEGKAAAEKEKKTEEERIRLEAKAKAAGEKKRLEAEAKAAEEEKKRREAEAKAVEEKKKAEEEKKHLEAEVRAAAEKKAEEFRARAVQKAEELRSAALKKAEEEKKRAEAEATEAAAKKARAEAKKVEEQKKRAEAQAKFAEEESNKLKAVETMLQKRKQQQIELEQIEAELLRKTNDIKKKKAELLELESEIEVESSSTKPGKEPPHYSSKEYRELSEEEKQRLREERAVVRDSKRGVEHDDKSDDNASSATPARPVLGPVVIDLGYKRVYCVSSGKLGTIPIWKKQRIYRNDRAKRMANEKLDQMQLGFPGIICLYEDADGKLFVIDGQHRVGMMQALREQRNKIKKDKIEIEGKSEGAAIWQDQEKYFQNVLVEVYSERSSANALHLTNNATTTANTTEGTSFVEQVYMEINKAEPLTLLDVPGVASKADRKAISEAVTILQRLYSNMFSPSQRCRSPDVNIDNLRNSIFGSNLLHRHKKLTSGKKLADWLMVQNAALGEQYERDTKRQEYFPPKAWEKASKNGFYLGLESSWLYK